MTLCDCADCKTRPLADRWHDAELESQEFIAYWQHQIKQANAMIPTERMIEVMQQQIARFNPQIKLPGMET